LSNRIKGIKLKIKNNWQRDLDSLSARQAAKYDDSLEVLKMMRDGYGINEASKQVGISVSTAKKYVGSALKIKDHVLVPKSTDHLLRAMRIYENGEEVLIQVKGLKKASMIGQYHSAVGRLVDRNEKNALELFGKIKIRDIRGKIHNLETNRKHIFDIFDRREEEEFFTIYDR